MYQSDHSTKINFKTSPLYKWRATSIHIWCTQWCPNKILIDWLLTLLNVFAGLKFKAPPELILHVCLFIKFCFKRVCFCWNIKFCAEVFNYLHVQLYLAVDELNNKQLDYVLILVWDKFHNFTHHQSDARKKSSDVWKSFSLIPRNKIEISSTSIPIVCFDK